MIIKGQVFDFSALNANDLDRLEAAQEHMKQADAAERSRTKTSLADAIRGQCRLVMDFLDELLGEGASARLGLTGDDFRACQQVVNEIHDRIAEEQAELQPQPTNREQRRAEKKAQQRRAEKKAQQRTQTAGRIVTTDEFIRRAPKVTSRGNPADTALRLADARVAMDSLRDDPEAMQKLADYALELAAGRHD